MSRSTDAANGARYYHVSGSGNDGETVDLFTFDQSGPVMVGMAINTSPGGLSADWDWPGITPLVGSTIPSAGSGAGIGFGVLAVAGATVTITFTGADYSFDGYVYLMPVTES